MLNFLSRLRKYKGCLVSFTKVEMWFVHVRSSDLGLKLPTLSTVVSWILRCVMAPLHLPPENNNHLSFWNIQLQVVVFAPSWHFLHLLQMSTQCLESLLTLSQSQTSQWRWKVGGLTAMGVEEVEQRTRGVPLWWADAKDTGTGGVIPTLPHLMSTCHKAHDTGAES